MDGLSSLLAQFEAELLPHERFAVAQGLVAPQWRFAVEPPPGHVACAYMDEATQRGREKAHGDLGYQLNRAKSPKGSTQLPYGIYAYLLDWTLSELRLGVVFSFAGFALLLRAVAGDAALKLAPSLFAAACFHGDHFTPHLIAPLALADMNALHEALLEAEVGLSLAA